MASQVHYGAHVIVRNDPDDGAFMGTVMPPPMGEGVHEGWAFVQPDIPGKTLTQWPIEWMSVVI